MGDLEKQEQHVNELEVRRYEGGESTDQAVPVITEASYAVTLNGISLVEVQCMPHELEAMAVGFLVAEGLLMDAGELSSVEVDLENRTLDVRASVPAERTDGLESKMKVTSGCGRGITIDNVEEVMDCGRPFNLAMTMPSSKVMELGYLFNHTPGLYRETRCVHSAALSDGQELLYFSEDIGRHNAVDQVVGRAFMDGRNLFELVLLCTGRFSFDMVAKAARVRIPLIISPAASTREAVLLARRFHMALCGRVRKASMTVYSCGWRITD